MLKNFILLSVLVLSVIILEPENRIDVAKNQTLTQDTDIITFYNKQCGFCHKSDKLMAPNMTEIKKVYLSKFPKKEDFSKHMIDYIKNPSKEKAIFKKGSDSYMTMPKMPYKDKDIKAVVEYIYDKI